MKYVSLFAGIGGFDLALNRLGHECVYVNEWDKYAAQTYEKNFGDNQDRESLQGTERRGVQSTGNKSDIEVGGNRQSEVGRNRKFQQSKNNVRVDTRDITKVPTSDIPNHDILVGGFPCQAFSIAGKRRGFAETRGTLFFEIARILKDKKTRYFILENVKGLLSHDNGRTFKTIISTLVELGYDIQWQVLNSKNFGVPQNRERVFIVGHLRGQPRPEVFPIGGDKSEDTQVYERERETASTVNTSIGRNQSDGQYIKIMQHSRKGKVTKYNERDVAGSLHQPSGNTTNFVATRQPLKFLQRNQKNIAGDYAFTVDGANTGGVKQGMRIRRLTPLECERLQGFPDNWTEGVSDTQRYKQLGNAVTVNVVYEVAKEWGKHI